jgi:hypothetical protein
MQTPAVGVFTLSLGLLVTISVGVMYPQLWYITVFGIRPRSATVVDVFRHDAKE